MARAARVAERASPGTMVVTDIVDSTGHANRLGGSRWNDLLARHNARMREIASTFRGREIKTTGDGFLVVFDGAARAVRCAKGWWIRRPGRGRDPGRGPHRRGRVRRRRRPRRVGPRSGRVAAAAAEGEVLVRRPPGTSRRDRVSSSRIEASTCSRFDGARRLYAVREVRSPLGVPVR